MVETHRQAGMSVMYGPPAAVHYSYAYSVAGAIAQFFDSGASEEHSYLDDGPEATAALWTACARYARDEVSLLWTTGQRRWIPYAAVCELAELAGLQLSGQHRLLPRAAKTRLSAHPGYWET